MNYEKPTNPIFDKLDELFGERPRWRDHAPSHNGIRPDQIDHHHVYLEPAGPRSKGGPGGFMLNIRLPRAVACLYQRNFEHRKEALAFAKRVGVYVRLHDSATM